MRARLAGVRESERSDLLLEVVRENVASVLGYPSMEAVEAERAFQELGFDSVAAIDLRKRLSAVTGLGLPASLVFDYPTSLAVAEYIAAAIDPADADSVRPVLGEVERLEAVLAAASLDEKAAPRITARLEALLRKWNDLHGDTVSADADYESATDDELFEVLDSELGIA